MYTHVCIYIYMYVCIYIYICVYICMYVCIYIERETGSNSTSTSISQFQFCPSRSLWYHSTSSPHCPQEDVDFYRPVPPEAQDNAVPTELLSCRGNEHTSPEAPLPRLPDFTVASSASSRSSVSNRPPETWI